MTLPNAKESYADPEGAKNHLEFLNSEDGQQFRDVLYQTFAERLDGADQILDVACGPGWLSGRLKAKYPNIQGCDGSAPFLDEARKNFPDIAFTEVDLRGRLPYSDGQFDTLIMSMAAHDVEDQIKTFTELNRILKPGGKLMVTIVNPYYGYPVGRWKRGLLNRLLGRKPYLILHPYHWLAKADRKSQFNKTLVYYFYRLSETLNNIASAGFSFTFMKELESLDDSDHYNFKYRLHRFPVILYLEFKKPA